MKLIIPLFSPTTGTWGGLTRVMAVAKAAQAAGHAVAFCASGYLESTLRKWGFPVYSMPATTFLGLPASLSHVLEQRAQKSSLPIRPGQDFGNIWLVLLLSSLARGAYLRRLVAEELHAAQDFQADCIFTDLDPGAFLLAQIAEKPIAAAYQTPMKQGIGSLPWKMLNHAAGSVLKAYHLPDQPVQQLCHGPQVLKIIPSIPELEGTDPQRPDVCYVGQLLGDFQPAGRFQPEAGKRHVFVYMGTGSVPMGQLRSVLPQVFTERGKSVCVVGSQGIQHDERIGGVEFRSFVPANEILPFCDWTICHAGQNTIIQSLVNKVPLLMFPGPIFERRYNARKVQAAEAGRMGEINHFSPEWLQSNLDQQPGCMARATHLSHWIHSLGGAEAAIRAIERWCD